MTAIAALEQRLEELLAAASPGPWKIYGLGPRGIGISDPAAIPIVIALTNTDKSERQKANARLAALAPGLAAALSLARALRVLGNTCGLDDKDEDWDVVGWISPEVPFAQLRAALDALADWERLVEEL